MYLSHLYIVFIVSKIGSLIKKVGIFRLIASTRLSVDRSPLNTALKAL